jgi:hypothetical protein
MRRDLRRAQNARTISNECTANRENIGTKRKEPKASETWIQDKGTTRGSVGQRRAQVYVLPVRLYAVSVIINLKVSSQSQWSPRWSRWSGRTGRGRPKAMSRVTRHGSRFTRQSHEPKHSTYDRCFAPFIIGLSLMPTTFNFFTTSLFP